MLHVFPALSRWHIATASVLVSSYIFLTSIKEVLYFASKTFFRSILSIFFRDIDVIGRENIPRDGQPVIFTVNHANQFIDALMVFTTSGHKVSYLIAETSWKRRIVGDLAWAMDAVPVRRAQDSSKPGTGRVQLKQVGKDRETLQVTGTDTMFSTQLTPGDKIRMNGTPTGLKVLSIESDTLMMVEGSDIPSDKAVPAIDQTTEYDILKRVDTKVVFEKVLDKLASGGAIGIFPEGGSHDRTELLPLKAGVSLIAYSALEQSGASIPIVPVGLNYFRAHRWRGRAVIEYGTPIAIDPKTLGAYQAGGNERRAVCNDFLNDIETSMKSVIVSTPDFETLEMIHAARRLYQRRGKVSSSDKQDLSRRFAEGYKRLMLMANGKPPPEWQDLQERIMAYRKDLKELGLKDYQVVSLSSEHLDQETVDGDAVLSFLQIPYQIVHLLGVLALAAVPVLFLNLPVGILAGLYSERRRLSALKRSKVKIHGYDVMLTEKVLFCIVMVPILWICYGLALVYGTEMDNPTVFLCLMSMPVFAYLGILASEAGMVDFKHLYPHLIRLLPSARRRLATLPRKRLLLQKDLRDFIRNIGPGLGEIYYKTGKYRRRLIFRFLTE